MKKIVYDSLFPGLSKHIPDHVGNGYMWVIPEELSVDLDQLMKDPAGTAAVEDLRYKAESLLDQLDIIIEKNRNCGTHPTPQGWKPYNPEHLELARRIGRAVNAKLNPEDTDYAKVKMATRLLVMLEGKLDYLSKTSLRKQMSQILDVYENIQ